MKYEYINKNKNYCKICSQVLIYFKILVGKFQREIYMENLYIHKFNKLQGVSNDSACTQITMSNTHVT